MESFSDKSFGSRSTSIWLRGMELAKGMTIARRKKAGSGYWDRIGWLVPRMNLAVFRKVTAGLYLMSAVRRSPPVRVLNALAVLAPSGADGRSIVRHNCFPISADALNRSPRESRSGAAVASSFRHSRMNEARRDFPLSGTPWNTKNTLPRKSGTRQYPSTSKIRFAST